LDTVQSLAFSPDGERLASGSFRTVSIWRHPHNVRIAELAAADADVACMAVSPDGAMAAIGETGGTIHLDAVATGKRLRTLPGHGAGVSGLAFNAAGDRLLSGSLDRTVRMWNVADGKEIGVLHSPAPVTAIALVLEGTQIAVATDDNVIRTWPLPGSMPTPPTAADAAASAATQPAAPQPIKQFTGHAARITSLAPIDVKASKLLSGSHDGTARIWDAAGGNQLGSYDDGGPITSVAVRPDGKRIATANEFGRAKLWNAENNQLITVIAAERPVAGTVNRLRVAVDLAKRRALNAKADLAQAIKDRDAEREAVYAAVIEVAKTDVEAKKKTEALTKPRADHTKAQETLTKLKADLTTAEDAKKKLADAAATPPAEPAATTDEEKKAAEAKKKADAEALKKTEAAVVDLTN
jgi:hypothetical protein